MLSTEPVAFVLLDKDDVEAGYGDRIARGCSLPGAFIFRMDRMLSMALNGEKSR